MGWYIPNLEPYVIYAINEIIRWIGDNPVTIAIILSFFGWLKIEAVKTKNIVDDKIISVIIYFFSFKWFFNLKSGIKSDVGDKKPKNLLNE